MASATLRCSRLSWVRVNQSAADLQGSGKVACARGTEGLWDRSPRTLLLGPALILASSVIPNKSLPISESVFLTSGSNKISEGRAQDRIQVDHPQSPHQHQDFKISLLYTSVHQEGHGSISRGRSHLQYLKVYYFSSINNFKFNCPSQ